MKTSTRIFLSLFLSFLCLFPTGAQADEDNTFEDINGLLYELAPAAEQGANGVATLVGYIGDGDFVALEIPATVTVAENVTYDVVSIGAGTFSGSALTSVTFAADSKLANIGANVFKNCDGLTSVTFPASLVQIGTAAFEGCDALASATLADGSNLMTIGNNAFKDCKLLTSVTLTGAESLTTIGGYAFDGCEKLASVELTGANALETIGGFAFQGIALKTVDLSWFTGLKEIGYGAFKDGQVEKLWLPENLETIGGGAFANCTALTEAKFLKGNGGGAGDGSSLKTIGESAFDGCEKLAKVALTNAESLTTIGSYAFRGAPLTDVALTGASSLETIGDYAFSSSGLTSLDFELAGAVNLETIGNGAFGSCTKMTSVKLPASLTGIGDYAFWNCEALASVTLTSPVPPTVGVEAFLYVGTVEGVDGCAFELAGDASLGAYLADGDWAESFAVDDSETETDGGFKFIVVGEDDDKEAIIVGYDEENENEVEDEEGFKLEIPEKVTVDEDDEVPVTTIGIGAFADLTGLTEVSFPKSVTAIGDGAFKGLKELTVVTFTSAAPPIVAADAFEGIAEKPIFLYNAGDGAEAYYTSYAAYMNDAVLGKFFDDVYPDFSQDEETGAYTLTKVVVKESVVKGSVGQRIFFTIPATRPDKDGDHHPVAAVKKSAFTDITSPAYITFEFEAATPPDLIPEEGEEEDKEIPDGIEFSCPDEALFAYRTSDDWWPYFQPSYTFTFTTSDEEVEKTPEEGETGNNEEVEGTPEEGENGNNEGETEETGNDEEEEETPEETPEEEEEIPAEPETEVELTATVTGLEEWVTAAELSDITLPETVFKGGKAYTLVAIEDGVFAACTGLKTFTLESTTPPALGEGVFADEVTAKTCKFACPDEAIADYRKDVKWAVYFPTPEPEPSEPSEPSVPDGGSGVNGGFRVSFYDVAGTLLSQTAIAKGDTVPADKVPALEAREGYTLFWYAGKDETNIWDFSSPVTAVLELHALWVEDEDEDDDTGVGAVIGGGNGAVALYNLRGQLVRKAIVTRPTSLSALREDLGVSSGIYILATPEGSRKVKL